MYSMYIAKDNTCNNYQGWRPLIQLHHSPTRNPTYIQNENKKYNMETKTINISLGRHHVKLPIAIYSFVLLNVLRYVWYHVPWLFILMILTREALSIDVHI